MTLETIPYEIPEELRHALRTAGGALGLGPRFERYVAAYFEEFGLLIYRLGLPGQMEMLAEPPAGVKWWVPEEILQFLPHTA